jgi:hypothetical protein
MKNKIYACYCCNIHRDALATPNVALCTECIRLSRTGPCYHQVVSDENLMHRLREEQQDLRNAWSHLNGYPYAASKIRIGNSGIADAAVDNRHIDCEPISRVQKVAYRKLLEDEMRLRGIVYDINCPTLELKVHLYEILMVEQSYKLLSDVLCAKSLDEAMIRLEQALPDLLHLENRSSEAIIGHLLRRGYVLREGNKQMLERFVKDVQLIMNERIFENPGCTYNWTFPINKDGSMGEIKFANWRARRIVQQIDSIIEVCLPGNERQPQRELWSDTCAVYRSTIEVRPLVCHFQFYLYYF